MFRYYIYQGTAIQLSMQIINKYSKSYKKKEVEIEVVGHLFALFFFSFFHFSFGHD
jgi:hypothetical protein